jgi:hypothetical protein
MFTWSGIAVSAAAWAGPTEAENSAKIEVAEINENFTAHTCPICRPQYRTIWRQATYFLNAAQGAAADYSTIPARAYLSVADIQRCLRILNNTVHAVVKVSDRG